MCCTGRVQVSDSPLAADQLETIETMVQLPTRASAAKDVYGASKGTNCTGFQSYQAPGSTGKALRKMILVTSPASLASSGCRSFPTQGFRLHTFATLYATQASVQHYPQPSPQLRVEPETEFKRQSTVHRILPLQLRLGLCTVLNDRLQYTCFSPEGLCVSAGVSSLFRWWEN